jgi:hypothetical protein
MGVDGGIAEELEEAWRAYRSDDPDRALELLAGVARRTGSDGPVDVAVSAMRLAVWLEAPALRLHFALCRFVAAPEDGDAFGAVRRAARHHPDVAEQARRMRSRLSTVVDWVDVARADPYTSWPQIEALGPEGEFAAWNLTQLQAVGLLEHHPEQPHAPSAVRGARVTRSGRSIAVGVTDPADGALHFVPSLSVVSGAAAARWSDGGEPVRAGRVAVVATSYKFSGYWHWLHECILQLIDLDRRGVLATLDRVLVCLHGEIPRYVHESLASTGLIERVEPTTEPFDLVVDTLALVNRRRRRGGMVDVDEDRSSQALAVEEEQVLEHRAIVRLREQLGIPAQPGARRIYVSRRDARKRRVANEDELIAALSGLGVEPVTLADRSFAEQVALFAETETVIGPHGAGLANLLFAPPDTRLVELQLESDIRSHYRQLARQVGARYTSLVCRPAPASPKDMVVDVPQMLAVLSPILDR